MFEYHHHPQCLLCAAVQSTENAAIVHMTDHLQTHWKFSWSAGKQILPPVPQTYQPPTSRLRVLYEATINQVSFCLMKKDRRCDNCHAQVTERTANWIKVHRTTRELVASD